MPAAIPLAIAAGSAISGVVGAKMSSSAAEHAADLQTSAAKYGADKQDAAAQRAEAFQRQQAENQWLNDQKTQRANYDQWKARQGTIAGVASQYGIQAPTIPGFVEGTDPHFDTSTAPLPGTIAGASGTPSTPQTGGAGSPSTYLKGLLDQGIDPQTAAQRTNSQFNLQTGSQAQYYAPSPSTSGKAVIGLPDSYISQEPNGWSVTMRGASAKAPAAGTIAAYSAAPASTFAAPAVNTPIPTPYQAGTIGAMGRVR